MGFIKRKTEEAASILYRFWLYPWVRAVREIKTGSIMKQRSYLKRTTIEGSNYIGKNAVLKDCTVGYGSYVQNGCDMTGVDIGKYTCIGSNVKTIIGSHPTERLVALHPAFNDPENKLGFSYARKKTYEDGCAKRTVIGSDVWLGNDVRVMGGVTIGDGAVVGAGAIVTKDLPPYSINVGIPAKTVKYRFTGEQIEKLLKDEWWDKDEQWIKDNIDRFADVEGFLG